MRGHRFCLAISSVSIGVHPWLKRILSRPVLQVRVLLFVGGSGGEDRSLPPGQSLWTITEEEFDTSLWSPELMVDG
ncbi:MAG: hypothetical protein DME22_06490 [Verrucomicrobia bacterium]|nr:MAG: hypothetical protein DME22_06490 [Verrucomicrobiota bacterium]PYJ98146.1 MAG: hypothetical protein DME23_12920 [Verrucomicrobiota bacterium]